MQRPSTPQTNDGKDVNQSIDLARIRKAILSDKPGRIGFTRFIHLAFRPPYRRSAGTPEG